MATSSDCPDSMHEPCRQGEEAHSFSSLSTAAASVAEIRSQSHCCPGVALCQVMTSHETIGLEVARPRMGMDAPWNRVASTVAFPAGVMCNSASAKWFDREWARKMPSSFEISTISTTPLSRPLCQTVGAVKWHSGECTASKSPCAAASDSSTRIPGCDDARLRGIDI